MEWQPIETAPLEMMRTANFPASLSLYWMCGIVWLYQGTLSQMSSTLFNQQR